ncbi:unnamed protein product [Discula destructiva]
MSSKNASKGAPSKLDDLDNFFLDGDLDDDLFGSPRDSNKRKSPGDVNVDEEVSVAKKVRAPRIKLDQDRLLSQKGVPALRKRAKGLKLKGKGHEWGDAARLLSFYQDWLDDLFPKAKFIDALGMVEKAGHNKQLQRQRVDWINEGRPKTSVVDGGGDADADADATEQPAGESAPKQATRIAPIFDKPAGGRPGTPDLDDIFGDEEDIYNATPVAGGKSGAAPMATGDEPDEDELDALMAMDEPSGPSNSTVAPSGAVKSLFGDGKPKPLPRAQPQPDEFDELDALMAEAENEPPRQKTNQTSAKTTTEQPVKVRHAVDGDEDDLDALMAEAEAQPASEKPNGAAEAVSKTSAPSFDDDEEAMAEMDGLW